ncbi:MAG: DUF4358 domain-containing protein [Oscillospiraceae bacterium]|nr:DUF4358 domain-containing protein [Oscillospiraceae bacterium]
MKRLISLLLSLSLLLALLPACSQSGSEPDPSVPVEEGDALLTVRELAETVLPASGREEALDIERLNTDEDADRLAAYIEAICGLVREEWEDAAVIRGMGASAFELVVLRLGDEDAAAGLEPVLTNYLTVRAGAFTGYAPAEAEMASNGRVRREGRTLGLFICPDPEGAGAAFAAACNGEALPAPVEPEPEPEPEPDGFTPLFGLEDLLHRLLLEAACPEWRSVEKSWSTPSGTNSATANWIPDDGGDWTLGGVVEWSVDEDGNIAAFTWDIEYEVSVYLMESEEEAADWAGTLSQRLKDEENKYRQRDDQVKAELLANGQAVSAGRYVASIVSDHTEDAVLLFPRIVNDPETNGFFRRYIDGLQSAVVTDPDPDYPGRVRFTPPNEEDMSLYDTSAILAAWEAADPSGLTGDDRAVYDAAEAVLSEIIRDGMSNLEKETAAYSWLVNNVDYDWTHQDVLAETDRRSYGPYGGLVDRRAVCLGYAASFQLLMNMCGVECITIVGAAFNSTGDHAWNMVKLNGEWYCVDVTWDANGREQLGDAYEWRYFNVTSDEMGKNHQWDYANTPEATAEDRGGAAA